MGWVGLDRVPQNGSMDNSDLKMVVLSAGDGCRVGQANPG